MSNMTTTEIEKQDVGEPRGFKFGPKSQNWTKMGYPVQESRLFLYGTATDQAFASDWKAVLYNNKPVGIGSLKYTPIPHEFIIDKVNKMGFKPLKDGRVKGAKYTKAGSRMFYTVINEELTEYISSGGKKDDLKVGAVIHNGLDGSMGIGVNMFTYRFACSNGAIFGSEELGKVAFQHRGQPEKLMQKLEEAINVTVARSRKLIRETYSKLPEIKVTPEIAKETIEIAQIPEVYLPKWMHYDKKYDGVTKTRSKDLVVKSGHNMWELFNDMTHNYWFSNDLNFEYVKYRENQLHKAMVQLVEARG
jgi:hypothetical protein